MHIVSVVTLLLGSIFAYSLAVPQFGGSAPSSGYYTLTAALANLAKELAAQKNTTVTVGNGSTIVSGISNSIANAHIDGNRNPGHGHGHHHHHIGWNNGYYNNVGGYWRGAAEEEGDYKLEGEDYQNGEYPEGDLQEGDDFGSKDEDQEKSN